MKMIKILMTMMVAASLFFASCKPKDEDIKTKAEAALKSADMMISPVVDVKDGIVSISGECKDEACKEHCEKIVTDIKGVKSVVNNCTITPPPAPPVAPPASMTTVLDDPTQQKVKDGLKDIPGVTVVFEADKAVISGEVSKANRMKIMQMLAAAKVKSDVSKLMDKK